VEIIGSDSCVKGKRPRKTFLQAEIDITQGSYKGGVLAVPVLVGTQIREIGQCGALRWFGDPEGL